MSLASQSPGAQTRVLVVDDSAFMRRAIERLLSKMPGVVVVGTAVDGVDGVRKAIELRPDVITMDVEMPRMDGVSAVGEIMRTLPTPIVMLSTLTREGADVTIRALEAGAVDCVAKPSGLSHELVGVGDRLGEAVRRAHGANVRKPRPALLRAPASTAGATSVRYAGNRLVVIGSSTGGPPALTEVVPHLPGDLGCPVVVIQHMPAGFTAALARRLDALSSLTVVEAAEGDALSAGKVFVAPGDFHLTVGRDHRVHLNQEPVMHGVRPAIDKTLDSVADLFGRNVSVAILTGMGRDGAAGAARVERAGGRVIVQDEATCVVYGMPRAARESTSHAAEAPLERVADAIVRSVRAA